MGSENLLSTKSLDNLSPQDRDVLFEDGYQRACAPKNWFHTWHVGNFTTLWTVEIVFYQGLVSSNSRTDDGFVGDTGAVIGAINQPPQSGWRTHDVPKRCRPDKIRWAAKFVSEGNEYDDEDELVAPEGTFFTETGVAWEDAQGVGGSGMNKPARRVFVMRPVQLV